MLLHTTNANEPRCSTRGGRAQGLPRHFLDRPKGSELNSFGDVLLLKHGHPLRAKSSHGRCFLDIGIRPERILNGWDLFASQNTGIRKCRGSFRSFWRVLYPYDLLTLTAHDDQLGVLIRMVLNRPCPFDPLGTMRTDGLELCFFDAGIHTRCAIGDWEIYSERTEDI